MLKKNLPLIFLLSTIFLFWFLLTKNNFFHWDDWLVFSNFGANPIDFILKPYAGHFVPLIFLTDYILFKAFGLSYVAFLIPTVTAHVLSALILYLTILKQTKNKKTALLSIPIFGISAVYIDVLIYSQGFNMISSALFVFLGYYLYLIFEEKRKYIFLFLSAISLIISPLFYEYGILMPFAFAAISILKNKRIKNNLSTIVYFLVGLINLGIYLFFSSGQTIHSNLFTLESFFKIILFVFTGLLRGLFLRFIYPGLHLISGHQYAKSAFFLILFLVLAIIAVKIFLNSLRDKKSRNEKIRNYFIYFILILTGYIAAGLGRVNFGLPQAAIPRYTYQPFFFLIVFLCFYLKDYINKWRLILMIYFVLLIFNIYSIINFENHTPKLLAKRDKEFLSDVSYLFKNNSTVYDFPANGVAPDIKISGFWFEIPKDKKINFISPKEYSKDKCKYCRDEKTEEIYKKFLKEYQQKLD